MQFSNGRVRFTGRQGRSQQAVRRKGEEGRQGPKCFRQGRTISKGLIDWGRVGAELLHLLYMERAGRRQPPSPPCNSVSTASLLFFQALETILAPQRAAPTCSPALPEVGEHWDYGSFSCCCHRWREPCGCHSCPPQAQKLPLAATIASSLDGGGGNLCMLLKHPLLSSLTLIRAGGLWPVIIT